MNTIESTNLGRVVRIAVPVLKQAGLGSQISAHFAKAPGFLIVDSDGGNESYLVTAESREPSECAPIRALARAGAKVLICHGIGQGALARCHEAGMQILKAEGFTVSEALASFRDGACPDFPDGQLCCNHSDHHDHGESCGCSD
ncbi:NifB/NifX family molybdenum-iron cluster-binding protein [Coraliomargarita parva]|uniref:NifB/NifX family molybdenum-iron cluster-binding protein n=1 Tax=Coraliomargarita parva TaxID=3014050 RepID=UPI0022B52E01|nr:NifB/NifX family molybdenum-iron cluster-binding protein [Coraliomargarita parva]